MQDPPLEPLFIVSVTVAAPLLAIAAGAAAIPAPQSRTSKEIVALSSRSKWSVPRPQWKVADSGGEQTDRSAGKALA